MDVEENPDAFATIVTRPTELWGEKSSVLIGLKNLLVYVADI